MKVVPEMLGPEEVEQVVKYGYGMSNPKWRLIFESESEAEEVKRLLERLVSEELNS